MYKFKILLVCCFMISGIALTSSESNNAKYISNSPRAVSSSKSVLPALVKGYEKKYHTSCQGDAAQTDYCKELSGCYDLLRFNVHKEQFGQVTP